MLSLKQDIQWMQRNGSQENDFYEPAIMKEKTWLKDIMIRQAS